jgi:hypothetical protein
LLALPLLSRGLAKKHSRGPLNVPTRKARLGPLEWGHGTTGTFPPHGQTKITRMPSCRIASSLKRVQQRLKVLTRCTVANATRHPPALKEDFSSNLFHRMYQRLILLEPSGHDA